MQMYSRTLSHLFSPSPEAQYQALLSALTALCTSIPTDPISCYYPIPPLLTLLLTPPPPLSTQTQYQALLSALTALCEALRPGALLKDVYAAAIDALKASPHPELAELLPKNLGSLTGIELREASHVIGAGG